VEGQTLTYLYFCFFYCVNTCRLSMIFYINLPDKDCGKKNWFGGFDWRGEKGDDKIVSRSRLMYSAISGSRRQLIVVEFKICGS